MRVAIQVIAGPAAGQRFVLRSGQIANVGKSDWNDFSFSEDDRMCDTQFQVRCERSGVLLLNKAIAAATFINGKSMEKQSVLQINHGDRILAGRTELQFAIDGAEAKSADSTLTAAISAPPAFPPNWVAERANYLELSDESIALAKDCDSPSKFEIQLLNLNSLEDAFRWKGYHTEQVELIKWGLHLFQDANQRTPLIELQSSPQLETMNAISLWIESPNEENRLNVESFAKRLKRRGIVGSLASAVSWSGGSLTLPPLDPVPPDPRLTSRCIASACLLVSHRLPSIERRQQMLDWLGKMPPSIYSHVDPKA